MKGRKYVMYAKGDKPYMRMKRDKNKVLTCVSTITPWLRERAGIIDGFVRATKEMPSTGEESDSDSNISEIDYSEDDDGFYLGLADMNM